MNAKEIMQAAQQKAEAEYDGFLHCWGETSAQDLEESTRYFFDFSLYASEEDFNQDALDGNNDRCLSRPIIMVEVPNA